MPQIPVYQVDAFSSKPFAGNPAAVCPLSSWLPDETLLAIAAENNLAETAFTVAENGRLRIRWFTPGAEVDLCGHATLATAHVYFHELGYAGEVIAFDSQSGELRVRREGDLLALDFPSRPPVQAELPEGALEAIGGQPLEVWKARDYMLVYPGETEVRALDPNYNLLKRIDAFGFIATATGEHFDFVSRFFAPGKGVNEDPVTGSAHCTLIPFWAGRYGKNTLHAFQASERGGELFCELRGDRVSIAGHSALFLKGTIYL
jgi:predicted PhzF superfamily epimerase YddE/YHI9